MCDKQIKNFKMFMLSFLWQSHKLPPYHLSFIDRFQNCQRKGTKFQNHIVHYKFIGVRFYTNKFFFFYLHHADLVGRSQLQTKKKKLMLFE